MQQRKWYLAEAVTTQTCFPPKKVFGNVMQSLQENTCAGVFFMLLTCNFIKKIPMKRRFPEIECKHL